MRVMYKRLFTLALITTVIATACKKDDTSAATDLPDARLGKYTGALSYNKNFSVITNPTTGTATISKVSDKMYSVTFSDNVPGIEKLKFKVTTPGSYATINEDGSIAGMTLDSTTFTIGVTNTTTGEKWAFAGRKQ
jgi:hypothetical protein